MLTRARLRRQDGSALITALLVMVVIIPLGLALFSLVDTQASESGSERTRDRAFNLADSALSSAAFNLGHYSWPATGASAPSNAGPIGAAGVCSGASFGAELGAPTNAGSATAKLQPNLNASYDDTAYDDATWQINVCDDSPVAAGPTAWNVQLLNNQNYDYNGNQKLWVRAEAEVNGSKRVLSALVKAVQTPALASKYGLMTGRINADVTTAINSVLTGGVLGGVTSALLGTQGIVAADPTAPPPASGVMALRCGALDLCLTGTLAGAADLGLVDTLVTGGRLEQATSLTAASDATIAQLKQQAIASSTHVVSSAGSTSSANPPACSIPAAANSTTIVYIERVGTGDEYCLLSVAAAKSYKALVIGSGRVVLRGNNTTTHTATVNRFTGLVYALNQQRATLGDASPANREVIRIDQGAHVVGGVAADGKSAQVGVYPPTVPCGLLNVNCILSALLGTVVGWLDDYNPAIQSDLSVMNAVKIYGSAAVVPGTYRDILGERR